ncbi:hypothetical protein ACN27G_18305 [Plantactinospora sp. WMMB334]|uniref:hypothetical protein n=1 Tax=Plantactinospora sp. WMMB334 TaxID=3404119 RepID=UPI003B93A9CD
MPVFRASGLSADSGLLVRNQCREIAERPGLDGLLGTLVRTADDRRSGRVGNRLHPKRDGNRQHPEPAGNRQPERDGDPPGGDRDGGEWRLSRDGGEWRLDAESETVRLPDVRGVRYLRTLLAAPGQEIPALDFVAGGAGLRVPAGAPMLDETARPAYRQRLAALDAADRAGDVERAAATEAERVALVAELRRATGLGGRPRTQSGESERARVNATRALWGTVGRVESAAPLAGAT